MDCFVLFFFIILSPASAETILPQEIETVFFTSVAAAKSLPLRPVFTKTMIVLDTCEIMETSFAPKYRQCTWIVIAHLSGKIM